MEQKYVRESIADDIRVDGRRRTELRSFSVRLGVNPQARGSAQIRLGETCVMCFLYSDVTDQDADASCDGIAFSARVIAASDDVSQTALGTLQADLSQIFGRNTGKTPAGRSAVRSVCERLFSGKTAAAAATTPASRQNEVGVDRCGVGIRIVAEISIMCGAGGNLVGATALAIKSALWAATVPRVHITASATGGAAPADGGADDAAEAVMEASAVEVDEKQRESVAALSMCVPVVVALAATDAGFYCVDTLREEEAAAAFDCVIAVQPASVAVGSDDHPASRTQSANIVYSRFHSGKTAAELTTADITTMLSESAAFAEQLSEIWLSKVGSA